MARAVAIGGSLSSRAIAARPPSRCRRRPRRLPPARSPASRKPSRAPPRACRRACASPQLEATTTWPPGRRTRATSSTKGGMLRWATRSKDSSSYGRSAASATRKATRPSGSRPTLPVAARIISSEMSTPRTLACGNSRARSSAPAPVPVPTSSARSGAGFTWRSAAARGARCSTEPAPVARPSRAPSGRRSAASGREAPARAQGARHDQPVQHAAGDADPPRRRSSLGVAVRHAASWCPAVHLDILPCRAVPPRPASLRADAAEPLPAALVAAARGAAALLLGALRRRRRRGVDLRGASQGCQEAQTPPPKRVEPQAAGAEGGAGAEPDGHRRDELRQLRDRARHQRRAEDRELVRLPGATRASTTTRSSTGSCPAS